MDIFGTLGEGSEVFIASQEATLKELGHKARVTRQINEYMHQIRLKLALLIALLIWSFLAANIVAGIVSDIAAHPAFDATYGGVFEQPLPKPISGRLSPVQTDPQTAMPVFLGEYELTFYTASAEECGNDNGITASGAKVTEGRTIAAPYNMPFGTVLEVEGFGQYVVEDRGGAIKGKRLDIYVGDYEKALQMGRQKANVTIVKWRSK